MTGTDGPDGGISALLIVELYIIRYIIIYCRVPSIVRIYMYMYFNVNKKYISINRIENE